jgi:hypothetical protein
MMSDPPHANEPGAAPPDGLDPALLRKALKAFKKRLELSQLDDESRLGHGPMSGGGRSGIVAVPAPNQYPQAVWDELVRQGKLRNSGHGLYELLDKS